MTGPLEGLVVVDMTRALAGPYATMLLADLGADVIKVEPPDGDMTRAQGPYRADDTEQVLGGYFQSVNRGKRSVVADLTTPEGTGLVRRLAAHADVLVENFRAGVMDRMGLSYETLSADNPRLVYGALRGFGDPRTGAGPYVDRPAYDVVAQAMGGLMAITGAPDGPPTKVGPGVGDIFPAALTVVGVLAAVHEARDTGRGRFVDVSMYDAMISLCERSVYQYSVLGQVAGQVGNDHPIFCPFGVYRTADGWVTVAAPGDRHWERLAEVIERSELGTDPRFATNAERATRRDEVRAVIEAWTGVRTRDAVVAALSGTVPCGPVNTADAIFADPHVAARNMLIDVEQPGSARPVTIAGQPIKLSGSPEPAYPRGPLLGEHTAEVLAELNERELSERERKGASADAAATQ